ncbi:MAG TPA: hypothetical protein DDW30_06035 [Clostridiales bacterium]|nr:hypothetical protein [Clostridiales bacterium]
MKHLRTLALVLCSILLLLTAASCKSASGGKPKYLYEGTYSVHETAWEKAETLSLSGTPKTKKFGFLYIELTNSCNVYDIISGKKIAYYNITDNETVEMDAYEIGKARCFALLSTAINDAAITYKTMLYNASGKLLESLESRIEQPLPTITRDLLLFGDSMYRANGSTLEKVKEIEAFGNHLSSFDQKMANRYYDFNSDCFSVYDSNGAFYDIYVYEKAEHTQYYLLENGNVLIQQQRPLPDDASKYDYSESGNKLQLKTYLWQAEKKAAKEISFDYLVDSIYPITQQDREEAKEENGVTFTDQVLNIASIAPIKNNMLQTSVWVLMDNSGSVTCNLSEQYKGLSGIPYPVADGVFAYETCGGQTFYIDGEGNLLRDMSTVDLVRGQYIVAGNKLYDTNYKLRFDFGKEGYKLEKVYETCAILSKGTDYIRFTITGSSDKTQNMTEIRATDTVTFEDEYYAVTASNGETTYYAPDGTSIYKSKTQMSLIHAYGKKLLFSDNDNGKPVYVLFTLK